jgi:uncharacterized protein YyaL (SSP411 family)
MELYEVTLKPGYLLEALNLKDTMPSHFWDRQGGGL